MVSSINTPLTIRGLTLDNRVCMAPMTRNFCQDGFLPQDAAHYYGRRAAAGTGLIITEGITIDHPSAAAAPTNPRLDSSARAKAWLPVVAAVHEHGTKVVPQLWHVGMDRVAASAPCPDAPTMGPSGGAFPGADACNAMSESDIDAVVAGFVRSAELAADVGFDGIAIHGGHGYLVDQFLWAETNRRTDHYGGSPLNRARFAARVVGAIRGAVGADMPIIFRFSQWKIHDFGATLADTAVDLAELLRPIVDAGVDVLDCSTRRFWLPGFSDDPAPLATRMKALLGVPTILVGSVGLDDTEFQQTLVSGAIPASSDNVNVADQIIASGGADLLAAGRAMLGDPRWSTHALSGIASSITFDPQVLGVLQ